MRIRMVLMLKVLYGTSIPSLQRASVEGLGYHTPYVHFDTIYNDWNENGEYRAEKARNGRERIDARILMLGCFAILAKDHTFDWMELVSETSKSSNHAFFFEFIFWFREFYTGEWIKFPDTDEAIAKVMNFYTILGLPGCIGSIDCVHMGWDMCPAGMRSDATGKEGYPTLSFEVVVSHTRRILAVTRGFWGTWNDKTIIRYDETFDRLKSEPRRHVQKL
mmetsp:Transcript_1820/g.4130  ORF Transcript_1820/g.4130 Transcript_1820/m.4130 type:complete len:220 (-) Transcript_1820:1705-2364(-)